MVEKNEMSWEEKLEKKMENLEKRLDKIGKNVEEKGEAFGKRVEKKAQTISKEIEEKGRKGRPLFWGVLFIVLGCIWLGSNLGWFYDIHWLPLLFIGIGTYLIIKNWARKENSEKTE